MKKLLALILSAVMVFSMATAFAAEDDGHDALSGTMARPVRVASICLAPGVFSAVDEIAAEIDRVGTNGVDLIVLPEVWGAGVAEPTADGDFDEAALNMVKEKAAQYNTYIVSCQGRYATEEETAKILAADTTGYWAGAKRIKFNTCFLVDRTGKIVYTYEKVYPYLTEFSSVDGVNNNMEEAMTAAINEEAAYPGDHVGIYDCDFGRLGMAICFDMNFPELWRQLGYAGAELVVWPSAYDGGTNVKARAATNNYYIVSCTGIGTGGCRVEDVTGEELIYQLPAEGAVTNTVEVTLNLDRTVFHKNFNEGKIAEAMEKYPGFTIDKSYYSTNEWIVAWSEEEGKTVQDISAEYGLTKLQQFKNTVCGDYIDGLRGARITWDAGAEAVYSK